MPTHFHGSDAEIRALDAYIKLTRAAETVSDRVNSHLTEIDLTISQFGVLEALYHLGPLHQSELAEKILRSTGNITHVIDQLENRGLVERHRSIDDRRYISVHLTDAGREVIECFFPAHVANAVDVFAVLTPEEQQILACLAKKLGLGKPEP